MRDTLTAAGRLALAFLLLGLPLAGGGAQAQGSGSNEGEAPAGEPALCAALEIPAELPFTCEEEVVDGLPEATVSDPGSAWQLFNRLRVRELEGRIEDPQGWLGEQVRLDLGSFAETIESWAENPENPFASDWLATLAERVRGALETLGELPAAACTPPEVVEADTRWRMDCAFDAWIVHQELTLELWRGEAADYALDYRSASERRERHFVALANSFSP